jgi:acyl carrier protein
MENIENIVVAAYENLLRAAGIEGTASLESRLGRSPGLDSLGLVNLIFEIEDMIGFSLDAAISSIRDSKDLRGVSNVIKLMSDYEGM